MSYWGKGPHSPAPPLTHRHVRVSTILFILIGCRIVPFVSIRHDAFGFFLRASSRCWGYWWIATNIHSTSFFVFILFVSQLWWLLFWRIRCIDRRHCYSLLKILTRQIYLAHLHECSSALWNHIGGPTIWVNNWTPSTSRRKRWKQMLQTT